MAGGMSRRGRGMPMEQRVALSSASGASPVPSGPPDGAPAPATATSAAAPAPARHCWVLVPADGSGERRAGLLLEWRRHDQDWQARVVYNVRLRTGGWALLEEWLPASDVTAG
jgi:hypothetical protein